jgi:hypothetical protein
MNTFIFRIGGIVEDKEAPILTEKAEKTRERIFQTALGLFVEQGYDKTTMRDIAKADECSLGRWHQSQSPASCGLRVSAMGRRR